MTAADSRGKRKKGKWRIGKLLRCWPGIAPFRNRDLSRELAQIDKRDDQTDEAA